MSAPARSPGRPRSEDANRAIVEATLDLIAEHGLTGLSVEAVAARAGVGKATIYRRWAGRDDLIADALATLNDDMPEEFPGRSLRDQMVAMLEHVGGRGTATRSGRIFPRMMGYKKSHPEWFALFQERVLEPRRERVRALLRVGIASGELRADLDVDVAAVMLFSPMLYLSVYGARGEGRVRPGQAESVVDLLLHGLVAR